jgi:uncharacterized membrane protein YtjA (UPF0391 family)
MPYRFAICNNPILAYGDTHHTIFAWESKETLMLLWIAIVIAVLWLLGLLGNIGGGLIHILLVIAVVVLVIHFIRGRSRV